MIIRCGFEVSQRRTKSRRNRHNLYTLINKPLVPKLLKHPPQRFHVPNIHGFVVVIKVNPATNASNCIAPLAHISLHNATTLVVISSHTELFDRLLCGQTQLLINLMLNRQTMTVPTKTAHDIPTFHGPVTRHNVLYSAGHKVAVMRQTGSKWRSIVKNIRLLTLSIV